MSAKVTLPWIYTTPPRNDDYLIVDKSYRIRQTGYYHSDLGWSINGRWVGQDAVECWQELPPLPENR